MTPAIIGLVGVVVGAVVTGGLSLVMERRRERRQTRASARLLEEELEPFVGPLYTFRASLVKPNETAFSAFMAQLSAFTLDTWKANRDALASSLADEDWYAVMFAYARLTTLVRELVGVDFNTALTKDGLTGTVQSAESAVYTAVDALGRLGGRPQERSPSAGRLRGSRW